jgi:tripeptide aminopeptidase
MKAASGLLERLLQLDELIQQIPSPTFFESQRSTFIRQQFVELGLAQVTQDQAGNILGCLPGGSQPPLVVSAHLDTVFPPGTDLHLQYSPGRITGPGIGDNSLGLAGLIGLVWMLKENQVNLPGDLWLAANTGEEGLGNLRGMRSVVDRFGPAPVAYLVVEGIGLGDIFHRGTGVARYRIHLHTPGGHPWTAPASLSAVHAMARLIACLADLPLPVSPRTTLNVGLASGGISINTIAAYASFELDLRSEHSRTLEEFSGKVREIIQQASRPEVRVEIEHIGARPSGYLPANHHLVQLAKQCLLEQGINPQLTCSSTDANLPLSRGFPALCVGLTRGSGAHTLAECIETEPVLAGMAQLFNLVCRIWTA